MTVIKRYNVGTAQWETIVVGKQGPTGATGATGPTGATGAGVPTGGATGQVLAKTSGSDYATDWVQPGFSVPPPVVGEYLVTAPFTGRTNQAFNNNQAICDVLFVAKSVTVDQINVQVTVAAASASDGRLAIYAPDANGRPDALIVDAGVFNPSTTGTKSITLSPAVTLPQGVVFLAVVQQGAAFQIRRGGFGAGFVRAATAANSVSDTPPLWGYRQSSVTGAFPANWTGTTANPAPSVISVKIASIV